MYKYGIYLTKEYDFKGFEYLNLATPLLLGVAKSDEDLEAEIKKVVCDWLARELFMESGFQSAIISITIIHFLQFWKGTEDELIQLKSRINEIEPDIDLNEIYNYQTQEEFLKNYDNDHGYEWHKYWHEKVSQIILSVIDKIDYRKFILIKPLNSSELFIVSEKEADYNDAYYEVNEKLILSVIYFENIEDARKYQKEMSLRILDGFIYEFNRPTFFKNCFLGKMIRKFPSKEDLRTLDFCLRDIEENWLTDQKEFDYFLNLVVKYSTGSKDTVEDEIMTYLKDYFYTIHKV